MNIPEGILKNDEKAIFRLRSLYRSRGYEPYRMSKFEEYDLYVRNKSFLVSDNIITFTDTDGKLMALKPDVTLSIVKNTKDGESRKLYYNENVYRVSEGSHSYKEIMQTGLECIGNIDTYALSEVLSLALGSLGEISEDFVLDVAHLGITSTLISLLGIEGEGKKRLLSCIGEKNVHSAEAVCREFGVDEFNTERIKRLIKCYGAPDRVISELHEFLTEKEFKEDIDTLEAVVSLIDSDKVRIDFSVVMDTTYYNGIVFKGYIRTIPSAVLSGGQYDSLMRRLSRSSGAVGFAVYLDVLEGLSTLDEYDVDTLVLYSDKTRLSKINETVKKELSRSQRVRTEKKIPEKLKYKTLVDITED